jgi:hypothetical protein
MPDWRDPNAYPADLTLTQWRWQFLRRREDYREDWNAFHPVCQARYLTAFRGFKVPMGIRSWEDHTARFADMPGCREKYGTKFLLNPDEPQPALGLFVREAPYEVSFASAESFDRYREADVRLIAFELGASIPEQIEKAKHYLLTLQSERRGGRHDSRKHQRKWPLYLRVLDARVAGATFKQIGDTLLMDGIDEQDQDAFANRVSSVSARAESIWQSARQVMFKLSP